MDTWTKRLVRRFSKAVGESCWGEGEWEGNGSSVCVCGGLSVCVCVCGGLSVCVCGV